MSYQLVTVKSPHYTPPCVHGTWPTHADAKKAAGSLVHRDETAEIRHGGRVVESFEGTGPWWNNKPSSKVKSDDARPWWNR